MRLPELREHAGELGFTPQEQVRWLAPGQLAGTAVKVVLAGVFADYSDKREIQAALRSELLRAPLREPETAAELWIDFVADLGDGFDATSTVAHTVAADKITVTDTAGNEHPLSRGALLVLGGDEIYPTASAENYEDRFKGPYRAALPTSEDDPLLVALPGNHDWYDGLTSFLRLFTQGGSIGGWRTRQTRSYFAVQLPQRWWLVGVDTQLGYYIDEPQLEYFRTHLSANLQEGDGVILCAPVPTWVGTVDKDPDTFNALHWFDRNIIRTRIVDADTGERAPTGASIRVWLTGDRHHYTRYAERLADDHGAPGTPLAPDERRRQMVTCGLGGAFLSSTHRLPAQLQLPPPAARLRDKDDPPLTFDQAPSSYPDPATSRRLPTRLALPWSPYGLGRRNPGFARLAAGVHAGLFVLLSALFGWTESTGPIDTVRSAGFDTLLRFIGLGAGAVAVLLLLGRLGRRARSRKAESGGSGSLTTVLLQAAVAIIILVVAVAIPWPAGWPGWWVMTVCLAIAGVLGAGLGTEAFALSILSARSGQIADWQMSGQAVEDYKGFLRLHIAPAGDLTIYPLAIDEVCHEWELTDDPAGGKVPVPASPLPPPRLLESPIVVAREVRAP